MQSESTPILLGCSLRRFNNGEGESQLIQVDDLHFTYPGKGQETIKGITFSVQKGEIFGFLGPSGAGKSTVQKILIGILKGYQGNVLVLGEELKRLGPRYYEKIGVSFELPNLYHKFTALENLSFFRAFYSKDTEDPKRLLAMVGLEEHANIRAANFSKGMKMRLNFCRAFLNNPELIFLDEPTSGLDPVNAKKVKEIILQKKEEGKTIFLTTHNMGVADEICDRVAFIVDGQIRLIDSPRELKIKYGKKILQVEYREGEAIKSADFSLERIGSNKDFLHLLQSKELERIHTLEATLEDIFIQATGRSLS